jgi:hypothetical protein
MENEVVSYLRCSLPKCSNPLTGQQRKFCSKKCQVKSYCSQNKAVYSALEGYGGPRALTSQSSIKKNESYIIGNGEFAVDDYPVDPDIFAIAEANHEKYVLDRNEYEARVVIDGLNIFKEAYNENHDTKFDTIQARKYQANLTEDQKKGRIIRSRKYYKENSEKINEKRKEKYAADKEKYREYAKKHYESKKEIIAQAREIRSERS